MWQLVHGNSCSSGHHSLLPNKSTTKQHLIHVWHDVVGGVCYYYAFVTIKTIHINMTHHKICSPTATFHLPRTIAWIAGHSVFFLLLLVQKVREWESPKANLNGLVRTKKKEKKIETNEKPITSEREGRIQSKASIVTAKYNEWFCAPHHLYTQHSLISIWKFNLFMPTTRIL